MTDYADFTLLQTGQQVQDILNKGQYAITYSDDSAYVLDSEQKAQARTNIDAASAADLSNLSSGVVKHNVSQSLNSQNKAQARTNIGAVGYENQSLTDAQKTQVRSNISAASLEDIENLDEDKANKDGYYPSMTVGISEQLIGDATNTDSTPYLLRKSSGSGLETNKLIGGTVAWNQLVRNFPTGWQAANGAMTESNGVAHYEVTTVGTTNYSNRLSYNFKNMQKDHVYLFFIRAKVSKAGMRIAWSYTGSDTVGAYKIFDTANVWDDVVGIGKSPQDDTNNQRLWLRYGNVTLIGSVGDSFDARYPMFIDLTAMFGTTIADYIYSLEQATAGAGVAWFKQYFPKDYYAYDAGSLISVKPSAHKMVGFNRLSSIEVNATATQYSQILYGEGDLRPNTAYCLTFTAASGLMFYRNEHLFTDGSGSFKATGNRQFIIVTTVSDISRSNIAQYIEGKGWRLLKSSAGNTVIPSFEDVCLNIFDPAKNGTYEPYEVHEYTLGSDELRGIPQLTDGKLSYDGDVKTADGQIVRNYAEPIDLGTLTWVYDSSVPRFYTTGISATAAKPNEYAIANVVCPKYNASSMSGPNGIYAAGSDKIIAISTGGNVSVKDTSYSDAASFKAAMSGVYLVYELATPTIEQGTAYSPYQRVSEEGTEEFVDERDVSIPVGHETQYYDVYSKDEMAELKRIALTSFATDTASGDIANFPDGADDIPVKSATFEIEPVQAGSGDPSPDNVRPISGWTGASVTRAGKNLFDGSWDANTAINGEGSKYTNTGSVTSSHIIKVTAGQAYYFNSIGSDKNIARFIQKYDANGGYIGYTQITNASSNIVTIPSGTAYVYLQVNLGSGTSQADIPSINFSFNISDTSVNGTFNAYATTSHVAWPAAGTVYDGTLKYLGGESWRVTRTMRLVDLGTLNWIRTAFASGKYGHLAYVTGIKPVANASIAGDLKCSSYKTFNGNLVYAGNIGVSMWATEARIAVYDSTMEDLSGSDFKAAMNGVQLVYPLATPETYDLTADELRTLLGTNNIWSDTGDAEVTYRADTGLYIQKMIANALNA